MKNLIKFENLIPHLQDYQVNIKKKFLFDLLKNASKSNKPHRNKDFAEKIGCKWNEKGSFCGAIANWIRGKRNITLKYLDRIVKLSEYSWNDAEKNLIFIKSKFGGSKVFMRFPLLIDKRFGSIIGYVLGDGSIDAKHLQVFFTNQNKLLLKDFQENMKSIFGIYPRIWLQMPGNFKDRKSKWIRRLNFIDSAPENSQVGLYYPKICGIILHSIFGEFAKGRKKKFTEQIFRADKDFSAALVRAFYDSEGSVIDREVRVFQDDVEMLNNIKKVLLEFEINANKIYFYMRNNKKRYYFSITGYYNLLRFSEKIGFISELKSELLNKTISHIKDRKSFRLRHDESREAILGLLKENKILSCSQVKMLLLKKYPDFKWDNKTLRYHLENLKNLGLINKENDLYKVSGAL